MLLVSKNFITKRIIFISLVLFLFLFLLIDYSNKNKIDHSFFEGEWSKDFNNVIFSIKISKNKECTLKFYYSDIIVTEKYNGTCLIGLEKKPFTLDIIKIKNHESIHSSLKVINKNEILLNNFTKIPKLRKLLINENISFNMVKIN